MFLNINTAYGVSKMHLFGSYVHNVSLKMIWIKIPFFFQLPMDGYQNYCNTNHGDLDLTQTLPWAK